MDYCVNIAQVCFLFNHATVAHAVSELSVYVRHVNHGRTSRRALSELHTQHAERTDVEPIRLGRKFVSVITRHCMHTRTTAKTII